MSEDEEDLEIEITIKDSAPANVKILDPDKATLKEMLLGDLGCGMPVRMRNRTLVGKAVGEWEALFDRNLHRDAKSEDRAVWDDGLIWDFENFAFWWPSRDYWERIKDTIDLIFNPKVKKSRVNIWRPKKGYMIVVYRLTSPDGQTKYLHLPLKDNLQYRDFLAVMTFTTRLKVTPAEAEETARAKLLEKLSGRQQRELLLTGMFEEVSQRSGVHYYIRMNRPTLAFRQKPAKEIRMFYIHWLAALCLHPLSFYEDTFCGSMAPSDEMLAHLLMIRTDEHGYWKKAGHHKISDPLAGV
jgi:hypothetical protein